jgi:hypothetical protein
MLVLKEFKAFPEKVFQLAALRDKFSQSQVLRIMTPLGQLQVV